MAALATSRATAQASRAEASTTPTPSARRVLQTQGVEVEEAPSPFWLVAGITLAAGGLALNIDSARRFDDGDPTCFSALDPGGCLIEAFLAGPVGLLGGGSLLLYGLWLGEHDASLALATGQPLQDYGALETWSLIGLIGGAALGIGVNVVVVTRASATADLDGCTGAERADRAEACGGGKILELAILQSVGYAIAVISAGPLGYTQGYDGKRREASKRARALVLPWASSDAFGLALSVQP